MPRYDYECESCGVFEAWGRMSDDHTECPQCGAEARRMISCPAIHGDGNDWSSENGGRGKFRPDYCDHRGTNDPNAYFKSRSDYISTLKRENKPFTTGI